MLVIGLGYVGLPLAREASDAGFKVVGFDLNEAIVQQLNSGMSHVDDVLDDDVARMIGRGFHATALEAEVDAPEAVVICVPTPLSADGIPDLTAVRGASELAGRILRPGMLVVLGSTSYPGTTDEVVRPLLEKTSGLKAGLDFSLAFSPERIDPGNKAYGLRNTPKGAWVLLRGASYKRDIADTRESPVPAVAHRLLTRGHCFPITTPYVRERRVDGNPVHRAEDLEREIKAADLVSLLQDHSVYDPELVMRAGSLVLDTRGRLTGLPQLATKMREGKWTSGKAASQSVVLLRPVA